MEGKPILSRSPAAAEGRGVPISSLEGRGFCVVYMHLKQHYEHAMAVCTLTCSAIPCVFNFVSVADTKYPEKKQRRL